MKNIFKLNKIISIALLFISFCYAYTINLIECIYCMALSFMIASIEENYNFFKGIKTDVVATYKGFIKDENIPMFNKAYGFWGLVLNIYISVFCIFGLISNNLNYQLDFLLKMGANIGILVIILNIFLVTINLCKYADKNYENLKMTSTDKASFISKTIAILILGFSLYCFPKQMFLEGIFAMILGFGLLNLIESYKNYKGIYKNIPSIFKRYIIEDCVDIFMKKFGFSSLLFYTSIVTYSVINLISLFTSFAILSDITTVIMIPIIIIYVVVVIRNVIKYHERNEEPFKRDPIEKTQEYKEAMKEIQPILDNEFSNHYFGMCHALWKRKKELLEEKGIKWKSPREMNPGTKFD